jgi:ribonuclease HI
VSRVELYTDGACSGNPGPGGWGALLVWGKHRKELKGGEPSTTNNRMELRAVIEGMRALKRKAPVTIYTDSVYVMKGITEWIENWKARGWKTAARQPVKNEDLWRELEAVLQGHDVAWQWVKGHSGHPGNEAADALARAGIPAQS